MFYLVLYCCIVLQARGTQFIRRQDVEVLTDR